jgi:hypothetical protein
MSAAIPRISRMFAMFEDDVADRDAGRTRERGLHAGDNLRHRRAKTNECESNQQR